MSVTLYALLAYCLTAVISLLVVAVIVGISKSMSGNKQKKQSDA